MTQWMISTAAFWVFLGAMPACRWRRWRGVSRSRVRRSRPGWSGWKGRRLGPVGMHDQQALVLVNHGGATAVDVLALATAVREDVRQCFGVELEQEPVLMPGAIGVP